ncbi:MAG: thioredoxin domain-containing protein [Deltaproteobacteria bacterium]|jgi:uncharacterized protein YyaL (SSP411 family)|nr:thioredoxin domain-containing protein [Deltaproteobacteria bacterium]
MANRLAQEKSPYLLQHAENPVDWYPWTDEAFALASRVDKPIFLSIGYSTCHWCHVMAHESFEDEQIAELMNEAFVCIKVDREERPDIDNIYMTVCSLMTGGGGWPLTIIMTPDKKPFFAGTYFAKHSAYGRIGMLDMIPRLQELWQTRRKEILQSTENILKVLQEQTRTEPGGELDEKILHDAFNDLSNRYDPTYAGFSRAPKFPTPHNITFLLRYWKMTGSDQALAMAEKTLAAMRLGGIYDQVGFGFHRYATDEKWLLPHFEKMLYDQALLAMTYLETYQITGNTLFKETVREIFTYVLRDLTAPEGGFYSAEDADSEGEEGKFYVWTVDELKKILSPEEFDFVLKTYNVLQDGNFRDEAGGEKTGANILHLSKQVSDKKHKEILKKLFTERTKKIHPHKDDKILTDWNGLMIAALAMGARILGISEYQEAASKSAGFILSVMWDNEHLLHRYRDGESAIKGFLTDYAFLVWGLLELYEASFDPQILKEAVRINDLMLDLFWDGTHGGFFLTPDDGETLLIRPIEIYDGALPSGNSIGLANLLRLELLTGRPELGKQANKMIETFAGQLREVPGGYTQFLSGLYSVLSPSSEIVIVGSPQKNDTQKLLSIINRTFLPNTAVHLKDPAGNNKKLAELAPFTENHTAIDNMATVYVCRNHTCKSPTCNPEQFMKLLRD